MLYQICTGTKVTMVFLLLLLSVLPPGIPSQNITYYITGNGSWENACNICKVMYTDLVTVHNDSSGAELAKMITDPNGTAWIALSAGNEGTPRCSKKQNGSSCCRAVEDDGSWKGVDCNDEPNCLCYKEGTTCHQLAEKPSSPKAQRCCKTDPGSTKGPQDTASCICLLCDKWQWADGACDCAECACDCVTLAGDGSSHGRNCSESHPALCYRTNETCAGTERRLVSFHAIKEEMNQSDAQAACRERYTNLATVYTEDDNCELGALMNENESGWIGLVGNNRTKQWSNGDPVSLQDQATLCSFEPCCFSVDSENLQQVQCTNLNNFVCFQQEANATRTYHLVSTKLNWYHAQLYCRKVYTDLACFRNEKEKKLVTNAGSKTPTPFWIGLMSDEWQWVDNGTSAYRRWFNFKHGSNKCVKIKNRYWSDEKCPNKGYPLCYQSHVHLSGKRMNWEEAGIYCSRENRSGLLEIENQISQTDVERWLRKENMSEPVWVGLRQSLLFGFWFWPSGNTVSSWANWHGAKQPEHQLSHTCVAIDP